MTYETEILFGIHSVLEAVKAQRRTFSNIYISKDRTLSRLNEVLELANVNKIKIEFVSVDHLDKMSKGIKHQGIAAKVTPFPITKAETGHKKIEPDINNTGKIQTGKTQFEKIQSERTQSQKFILVLEGIEDPNNLGAIIRTALCAGVDHIVIPKDRAVQPSPTVSRASAGAMEHAEILIVTNITSYLKNLKKQGVWIVGLDINGDGSLFGADLTGNIAIVVGGEHQGIRPLVKKECDFLLSLPLAKGVTSLNASVACGIALYEVVRQRIN